MSVIRRLYIGTTNNAGGYGYSFDYITDATLLSPAVSESASLGLLCIGAAGLLLLRRKPAGKA
ncbi:MAG: PEP-CTERM sorting domain-containing protein [Phycisphaerae bacterium]